MNELQIVDERKILGKDFRIYGDFENPLFLAKDISEWIEHSRTSEMLKSIDEEEKLMQTILASGQNREMWFLTEDGVYEVLMQSRKPIAKEFKKKVKEILKDIRKHGMYATENTIDNMLNNPDFAITLLTKYKEEKEARKLLEIENERNKPKVEGYNQFLETENLLSWDTVAKNLKIGRNTLLSLLRDKGILAEDIYYYRDKKYNGESHNVPYQRYMQYFDVKYTINGNKRKATTKVTAKGQEYLAKKLKEWNEQGDIA